MTERQRTAGGRIYDQHNYAEGAVKMATNEDDLSPRKTLLVFVVIIGCFAVLWPKLFYPMLVANANQHIKPSSIDKTTGCCDVISETDVNTIKIMSELCSRIIEINFEQPPKPKQIVTECRRAVLEKCNIDISAVLHERVSLGHSVKQILEEVRSLNGSLCLKYNFGVSPSKLGVPHRVTVNLDPSASIRQERPSHLRSEMVHPAFRERGRAIPQPEAFKRAGPSPRIIEGRPGPVPGIRPAMGGAGHVVPSKQQHTGVMGLLMPVYTIGIVIFFTYTLMKVVFKKKPDSYASLYPPVQPDEHFRKEVFQSGHSHVGHRHTTDSKLGDVELDQLRQRLRETELAMERIVEQMAKVPLNMQGEVVTNGAAVKPQEDQGSVKVMGMETTASCEGGKKWSRPDSPVVPTSQATQPEPQPEPQEIFLEGTLPPQSQLLVADSATETQQENDDSAVVLAGKMTLSVISLDSSENGTDESSNPDKKRDGDDQRGTGSSHGSDEFEKIDPYQLDEQIKDFNEESEIISEKPIEKSDSDFSFIEEIERINQDILEDLKRESAAAQELSSSYVLDEIKEQLNLDDDLLKVLGQEVKTAGHFGEFQEEIANSVGETISQHSTSNEELQDKQIDEVQEIQLDSQEHKEPESQETEAEDDPKQNLIAEDTQSKLPSVQQLTEEWLKKETIEQEIEVQENQPCELLPSKHKEPGSQACENEYKQNLTEETQSKLPNIQQETEEWPNKESIEQQIKVKEHKEPESQASKDSTRHSSTTEDTKQSKKLPNIQQLTEEWLNKQRIEQEIEVTEKQPSELVLSKSEDTILTEADLEENDFLNTLISISQRAGKEDEEHAEDAVGDKTQAFEVKDEKDNKDALKDDTQIDILCENIEKPALEERIDDAEQQQEITDETGSNCEDDEALEGIQFEENISDQIANEIRDEGRIGEEERILREHVNGNNISPLQDTEDDPEESLSDEDEDIEEIIEYVENTDEEGEEIIEVANGVSQINQDQRNVEN